MYLTAIETGFRIGLLIAVMNVTDLLYRLPPIERQELFDRTFMISFWTLFWLTVAGLLGWLPLETTVLMCLDLICTGLIFGLVTLVIIVGEAIWRALGPESADELWGLK